MFANVAVLLLLLLNYFRGIFLTTVQVLFETLRALYFMGHDVVQRNILLAMFAIMAVVLFLDVIFEYFRTLIETLGFM